MNPELLRNLWLEAQPLRLALIAGILLLVFGAASSTPGLASPAGAGLALYWFFAVLWGTRSAALSVVAEIRERTWDSQKLSSIGPGQMMLGKLLGATSANWFGALVSWAVVVSSAWRVSGPANAITFGLILLALGVFAQTVALLSSLMLIRRNTGNWRLDTFLCQVAGIGAAFGYYSLWSSIQAFEDNGARVVHWWGHEFALGRFHLASLLLFLGWALVGCYRAMRAELRFANGPWVWLAWLLYLCVYDAGFASVIAPRLPVEVSPFVLRLGLAGLALLLSTYGMVFLEPKDPVRLRWLAAQMRSGKYYEAFLSLDAWMLSYAATLAVGMVLIAAGTGHALAIVALLGFLTRDIAIFLLMRVWAGAKGDFGALAVLGALYLLIPTMLGGGPLTFLFLPGLNGAESLSALAAWTQAVVGVGSATRSMATKFTSY